PRKSIAAVRIISSGDGTPIVGPKDDARGDAAGGGSAGRREPRNTRKTRKEGRCPVFLSCLSCVSWWSSLFFAGYSPVDDARSLGTWTMALHAGQRIFLPARSALPLSFLPQAEQTMTTADEAVAGWAGFSRAGAGWGRFSARRRCAAASPTSSNDR